MKFKSNWTTTGNPRISISRGRGLTLERVFWVVFGIALALIISWYSLIGYVAVKAVDHVDKHGLKSTWERVWEGPQHEHR
jgi:hypothetical protein